METDFINDSVTDSQLDAFFGKKASDDDSVD